MKKLKQKRNFTLVELLVVIAIIAILASMLLPALNRGIEASKKIACLGNLKQSAMCTKMYASDFNDLIMVKGKTLDGTASAGWAYMCWLSGYLKLVPGRNTPRIYDCSKSYGTRYPTSYHQLLWTTRGYNINGLYKNTAATKRQWSIIENGLYLIDHKRLKNPSAFIGHIDSRNKNDSYQRSFIYDGQGLPWAIHHKDFVNVAFGDGHADSLKVESIGEHLIPNIPILRGY